MMKNTTLISGVVSSIIVLIGGIFKFLHWPGAGIALTVGGVLFLAYALLLYTDKQALATTSLQKVSNAFVLIGMLLLTAGFIFKMQHWPGARLLIYISNIVLLALVPVSFIKASKETEPVKKLNFNNEAIVLIVLLALSLLTLFR